jgi:hypothetical protein
MRYPFWGILPKDIEFNRTYGIFVKKVMIPTKMKFGAGIVCIVYILVQTFQWWVFTKAPEPSLMEDFLFGSEPISLVRSWLMLFSMFGLLYIFFVICFSMD